MEKFSNLNNPENLLKAFNYADEIDELKNKKHDESIKSLLGFLEVKDSLEAFIDELGKKKSKITEKEKGICVKISLLNRQFKNALKNAHVCEIPCIGEIPNEKVHMVLGKTITSDKPAGIIIEVRQKGYYYKEGVLRLAKVIVSETSSRKNNNNNNN